MVTAEELIRIHRLLIGHGVSWWINGGWGIDALLERQTRPHKDIDFLVTVDDVPLTCAILGHEGYYLNWLWEENQWLWTLTGSHIPTGFVLENAAGDQMDIHAMWCDDDGNCIPAWMDDSGFTFSQTESVAVGYVNGYSVPCFSAELQVLVHSGYELPSHHQQDMRLLAEKFGITLPLL